MSIKAGEFLLFTSGSYSDYQVNTLCRTLKDFDSEEESNAFALNTEYQGRANSTFVAFLVKRGLVEEIEYREVHPADYEKWQCDWQ